jgi:hypothetical protein
MAELSRSASSRVRLPQRWSRSLPGQNPRQVLLSASAAENSRGNHGCTSFSHRFIIIPPIRPWRIVSALDYQLYEGNASTRWCPRAISNMARYHSGKLVALLLRLAPWRCDLLRSFHCVRFGRDMMYQWLSSAPRSADALRSSPPRLVLTTTMASRKSCHHTQRRRVVGRMVLLCPSRPPNATISHVVAHAIQQSKLRTAWNEDATTFTSTSVTAYWTSRSKIRW